MIEGNRDDEDTAEGQETRIGAFIYKCVSMHKVNGSEKIKLWFDTMASHSITSDIRLFGERGPQTKVEIYIKGWNSNDEKTRVTKAGMTIFGLMLYYPDACGTIISSYEAKGSCYLKFTDNDIKIEVSPHY